VVFLVNDLPILVQLFDYILFISGQISKNAIQLDPLNEVFTELDERKPLGDALDQSSVLVRGLEVVEVLLDLQRHLLKQVRVELVLLNLSMILLHDLVIKLFVK
jgi:hypothetical protein